METQEFRKCFQQYFKEKGFEKLGSRFFKSGNGFLCEIAPFRSYYGEFYYFDYTFFIGKFEKPYVIDRRNWMVIPPCVYSRFDFNPKDKCMCFYRKYTSEELHSLLDVNMKKVIYPVFLVGKKHILENLFTQYEIFLIDRKDEIIALLSD